MAVVDRGGFTAAEIRASSGGGSSRPGIGVGVPSKSAHSRCRPHGRHGRRVPASPPGSSGRSRRSRGSDDLLGSVKSGACELGLTDAADVPQSLAAISLGSHELGFILPPGSTAAAGGALEALDPGGIPL